MVGFELVEEKSERLGIGHRRWLGQVPEFLFLFTVCSPLKKGNIIWSPKLSTRGYIFWGCTLFGGLVVWSALPSPPPPPAYQTAAKEKKKSWWSGVKKTSGRQLILGSQRREQMNPGPRPAKNFFGENPSF